MKQSMVQITEASLANASISASVESLLLSNDQLSLHQLQASSRKSDNRWQIHLPAFSLEGVQVPQNKEAAFSIRKAVVQQPRSSFSWNAAPHKKAHNQPKVSSGLAVKLDTLLINDAQWEFAQSKNGVSQQWESANTSISALDLAYPFEMDELLEQQIDLSLKDVQHQSEQAQFTIASLDVSVRDQQLDIRDVDFTINQNLHDALARIHGEIPSLLLRTSLPAGWQPSQEWRIRDFLISSPQLMVNYRKQAADKASKPQKAAGTGTHPSLLVENLNIKDLGISLEADAQETTLALEGLDFSYQDLQWEQDQPIGIETLTSHSDWQLELNHFYAGFAAPRQEAHMFGLKLNPVTESLAWDSSRVAPKASPLEFSQLIDFQKSWISVNTGKGAISGLDLNKLSKGEIHAPRVKIQRPRLEVFRDKRLPFPENHYPPMLHKALAEARIPISIDTVELNDARIHVNIQPPRGEQLASIRFTNAEVYLTNVTNLPEEIKLDHLLKAQAYAKIQDAALLQAKMEFDLNHPAYPFFIEAELGKMDLRELNSLTEPIASVRIRKGVMRRMNFQALANEDFAYGNMDFMYRRLNIQMLSKKHPERQGLGLAVESFLANRLILRKNNDYPFPHRQGQLYVERDDTRSVFNYFAKIALNGILSSAGVKSNRKALHKEYKSRREQYLENQQNPMGVTSLPE